jgi:hypothetical protein
VAPKVQNYHPLNLIEKKIDAFAYFHVFDITLGKIVWSETHYPVRMRECMISCIGPTILLSTNHSKKWFNCQPVAVAWW